MNNGNPGAQAGQTRFRRYLSPLAVWALSFGCSVGWGAFVMPGTVFLPIAGPVGTAIGMTVGALVMFVIGVNYAYLMNRFPDAGGTFSFTKNVFGYDHAFLSTWFMGLVYLAIIWANCTALPLIFRTVFGDVLRFGYMYTVAGYEVYAGEVLLSLCTLALFGAVCMLNGRVTAAIQTVLALILAAGIVTAFVCLFLLRPGEPAKAVSSPAFSPSNSPASGALFIVFLAPWAFAGFESVSHSAEEFRFPVGKTLTVMTVSLATSAVSYVVLALVAASAAPEGYSDWFSYVSALGDSGLSGVAGMPVFNAISTSAGGLGVAVIALAAGAAIVTGLLGNTVAASRLLCSVARDGLIGEETGRLNRGGVPGRAVLILLLISIPIPFFGRSATGWVVDINTIGVTIAYAYTSAAAFKLAKSEGRKSVCVSGAFGMATSLFFLLYFLIPNAWSASKLSTESYFMLLVWILIGFVAFSFIFRRDKARRIGRSTVVWFVMMLLIFSTAFIWLEETIEAETVKAVNDIYVMEEKELSDQGVQVSADEERVIRDGLYAEFEDVTGHITRNTLLMILITILSLLIIFRIYSRVRKSQQTAVEDKLVAERSSNAKSVFLSNMSHDIRTPLNAIIGYASLARNEKDLSPAVDGYLGKIEASGDHLLSLINDVLEMSRIESGRMELMPVPTDLRRLAGDVRDMFSAQMEGKGLAYTVECRDLADPCVLCDANRLNRVMFNLISNAYKYTPEGGSVSVTVAETGRSGDTASFRISVKDTGIGMSPEFAAKVFEAYERERTATVENIQGTGLGTAITKRIVDLMGGTIEVFTEQGKGSEFVVRAAFPVDPDYRNCAGDESLPEGAGDFGGMRILLVDDKPDNLELAKSMFEGLGFEVDTATDGDEAVEAVASSPAGTYDAVVTDIEMPGRDGYETARLIRSLRNPELAGIPVVALTAKAFSEDIAAAMDAGMDAHIAKPVTPAALRKTMAEVLLRRRGAKN